MKILLAIDGSKHSNKVVDSLATRPLPVNTTVHILTAYDTAYVASLVPGTIGSITYHEDLRHKELEFAKETTHKAAEKLITSNPALTIVEEQVEGPAKRVILDYAEKIKADLIVLGSQGLGSIERFLLGSVSQTVAQNAHCSVEIVR